MTADPSTDQVTTLAALRNPTLAVDLLGRMHLVCVRYVAASIDELVYFWLDRGDGSTAVAKAALLK